MALGMEKVLASGYDEALERIPEALKTEGFGVLTEIDVADTLKKKLGGRTAGCAHPRRGRGRAREAPAGPGTAGVNRGSE